MERITITLDAGLLADIDRLAKARGYQNRSEAIRDLARAGLQTAIPANSKAPCVAALVYVYDHSTRDLARRLTDSSHHHHDISLATLHVHLDAETCLEVTALKGTAGEIQHFSDHIISERGVRYGQVVMIPVK